jgi:Uma2 family endonuclease
MVVLLQEGTQMTDKVTTKPITAADVEAWEIHNPPQEIVDGEWTGKPKAVGQEHALISMNLSVALYAFVKKHQLGRVYGDNLNYVLEGEPGNIVRMRIPDLSFVAAERTSTPYEKGYYYFEPDLAVEIISPNETKKETAEKIADYLHFGTRQVWVIDPEPKQVTVHFPDGSTQVYNDILPGGDVLPGFELPISQLFE